MSIPTLDNYVALDCEMVVTNGKSLKWETIALARLFHFLEFYTPRMWMT